MIKGRFFVWLFVGVLIWFSLHLGLWPWASFLLLLLGLLPIFALVSAMVTRRSVALTLRTDQPSIERGQKASWTVVLSNQSRLQALSIRVRYKLYTDKPLRFQSAFQVAPRSEQAVLIEMDGRHCGLLQPTGLQIFLEDPLGFFRFPVALPKDQSLSEVAVLPLQRLLDVEADGQGLLLEEGEQISQKSETLLDEIDRMRPMQPGDRMRDIHWKLSARTQSWMVRQYEKANEAQVTLLTELPVLEGGAAFKETLLLLRDQILDRVSSLAQTFLNTGFRVRLVTQTPQRTSLVAKSLEDHLLLRQQLARIPDLGALPMAEQLRVESLRAKDRYYLVVLYHLDDYICAGLKVLASQASGVQVECLQGMQEASALASLRQAGIGLSFFEEGPYAQ